MDTSSANVKKLDPKDVAKYSEIFEMFDKTKRGSFGVKELKEVMQSYGLNANEQQLYEMVAQIDTNNNGLVTFDQFMAVFTQRMADSEKEEEMREAFKVLDKDGNGFLPIPYLKRLMTEMGDKMTNEEWDQLLETISMTGNEDINYEEMITILMSTQK
ncbi:unnamed protein product [Oppiella nova]|uniref:EF-hand domain-containing protein n=1 Tax=Oppiella nova TaxID=334625 RepID=A0A7R9LV97_9ACAR|nr:unnamed protein product [Oppiella nova]CAG2166580.1 unnamed protein product [Oppiella nova]